ncbi:MAG TPA: murein L,D-transpeptidase [Actinobacteria bacterium]|nr:murein L,D-transpeptidase [Actinomycetota bacterium]
MLRQVSCDARLKSYMGTKGRRITIFASLVAVVFIGSWGVVFASAEKMLDISPRPESRVASDKPVISVKWLNIPGVNIKSLSLFVDGEEQAVTPPSSGTGINFVPPQGLSDGEHKVKVQITVGMGVPRELEAEWSFEVDTQAPPLGLADGNNFFVSNGPNAGVPIKSEPGAQIEASINDEALEPQVVDKEGNLEIALIGLDDTNTLEIIAVDDVGNARSVTVPVIKDETAPVVNSIMPPEGEVVRVVTPQIDVSITEEESGLKSLKLFIDGQEAVSKGDDGSKRIVYIGELLSDGEHTATVEAVDYAEHITKKEWAFSVDSRRIIVNRGQRRLYFYRNGELERTYRVAVGMPQWPTPGGSWKVVNKQPAPRWINPGSSWAKDMPKVLPAGPGNPLGVRALALDARAILIHGTSNYASIGRAASHGCIRMRNGDILNFYPLIGVGTPVDII